MLKKLTIISWKTDLSPPPCQYKPFITYLTSSGKGVEEADASETGSDILNACCNNASSSSGICSDGVVPCASGVEFLFSSSWRCRCSSKDTLIAYK